MAENPKITQIKVGNTTYDVSDSTAVQKSGDTMTGTLTFKAPNGYTAATFTPSNISQDGGARMDVNIGDYHGKIDIGGNSLVLEGDVGDGEVYSAVSLFLTAGASSTNNQTRIILKRTGGIELNNCIANYDGTNPTYGYYKLPCDDGSVGTNRYTIATEEWISSKFCQYEEI